MCVRGPHPSWRRCGGPGLAGARRWRRGEACVVSGDPASWSSRRPLIGRRRRSVPSHAGLILFLEPSGLDVTTSSSGPRLPRTRNTLGVEGSALLESERGSTEPKPSTGAVSPEPNRKERSPDLVSELPTYLSSGRTSIASFGPHELLPTRPPPPTRTRPSRQATPGPHPTNEPRGPKEKLEG